MGMMSAIPVPIAVPLAEARAFLRLGAEEDEAALTGLLRAASAACEAATGLVLVRRALTEIWNVTGDWQRLAAAPVVAITAVEGLPADGAAFPLPVVNYAIDIDACGAGLVRVMQPGSAGRVRVTLTAGLADAPGEVPESLRQGIMLLTGQWLRARDGEAPGPGEAVAALWRGWRRVAL